MSVRRFIVSALVDKKRAVRRLYWSRAFGGSLWRRSAPRASRPRLHEAPSQEDEHELQAIRLLFLVDVSIGSAGNGRFHRRVVKHSVT